MFQKKQIIYSEEIGLCIVDNIVNLSASRTAKPTAYYVLKPFSNPEKASYIPVENHQVALRELFNREEARNLKADDKAMENPLLKAAVEYVLNNESPKEKKD